ncbi:hypothetical protein ZHAS_00019340 [Anopheles sinensis]|uniref:Uncharacterized protein n=1 Tax=Anopheles sinensis TaxID=74873 RepID=A0A084WM45_ANOSI|nr:hypothetical protein ZHAS_00019340 [Anopheles sinensis]
MMSMAASADHCVIAVETRMPGKEYSVVSEGKGKDLIYQLLICNSISTTDDFYNDELNARDRGVNLLWHYHTPKGTTMLVQQPTERL